MLKGRCFCGAVCYEAGGVPTLETNCHCSICRHTSGAPFVAWFTVPKNQFSFVTGQPARFESSEHGTRTFCARCGTPLTFESAHNSTEIDVTTCTLENPECLPPKDHIHTGAKLSWVQLCDNLPAYTGARSE